MSHRITRYAALLGAALTCCLLFLLGRWGCREIEKRRAFPDGGEAPPLPTVSNNIGTTDKTDNRSSPQKDPLCASSLEPIIRAILLKSDLSATRLAGEHEAATAAIQFVTTCPGSEEGWYILLRLAEIGILSYPVVIDSQKINNFEQLVTIARLHGQDSSRISTVIARAKSDLSLAGKVFQQSPDYLPGRIAYAALLIKQEGSANTQHAADLLNIKIDVDRFDNARITKAEISLQLKHYEDSIKFCTYSPIESPLTEELSSKTHWEDQMEKLRSQCRNLLRDLMQKGYLKKMPQNLERQH